MPVAPGLGQRDHFSDLHPVHSTNTRQGVGEGGMQIGETLGGWGANTAPTETETLGQCTYEKFKDS